MIGDNFAMAKLASKVAKPNGIYSLDNSNYEKKTDNLAIGKLPGIGKQREKTLNDLGIFLFRDARALSLIQYKKLFGPSQGGTLHGLFNGRDG